MVNRGYLRTCADAPTPPVSVFRAWSLNPLQIAGFPSLPSCLQRLAMSFFLWEVGTVGKVKAFFKVN